MKKIIKRLSLGAVCAALIFLLVQLICNLFLPVLMAGIVNNGIVKGNIAYIWQQGLLMILITVAGFAAALLNTNISAKISCKLACKLREDIYRKVSQFSNDEFDKIGTSSLITRNTNDVTQVQTLVEMGLNFLILAPLYLIGGVIMAYRLSPSLTMTFIVVVPFIAVACIGISLYANPLFAKMQQKIDRLNLIFREGLNGMKVIRAFNKEEQEYDRYEQTNEEYTKISIKVNSILNLLMPLMSLMMSLAIIVITWRGGKLIAGGSMEIGTMMGVVNYSIQILTGFMMITNVISSIPRGLTSAKRVNEVLDMPLSIRDIAQSKEIEKDNVSLQFERVSYRYQGAEKDALKNISFTVQKGQTLALIGSTGSGKTTLVNLISRFYDVESGSVLLNGTDIRNVSQKALHEEISLVPQMSVLFFGTVRENMQLGNPTANDEEIWDALETANATEFIKTLEGGLDSIVEKGGGNFSGGQKQRLCIARALLKSASIYLFDDSFSALDFKTDAQIRLALKDKLGEAITIIVAQRISTIMNADRILVLNEGQLVGSGTHDELKSSNNIYQEIIASQFEREAVA